LKNVFIKPRFDGLKLHSLFNNIRDYPPEGYKIHIANQNSISGFSTFAKKNRASILKNIMYYTNAIPYIIFQKRNKFFLPNNIDLIWASSHILSTKKNWIVSLESVDALSGYYSIDLVKGIIEKQLKSESCKSIIAFSEWAKQTLENCYDNKKIIEKVEIIPYTVYPKQVKRNSSRKIKILFVGTNNPGTVQNFEHKGVREIVEAFIQLQKEFGDEIQLTLRTRIPDDLKNKITSNKEIVIIENIISMKELENLYINSDIFPHVGYETANLSILEAMSYGLPVIGLDIFNTNEVIMNNQTGILIPLRKKDPIYTKYDLPNSQSIEFSREMKIASEYIINQLIESIRKLIINRNLREKLGNEAKKEIEVGKFSIDIRNQKLKQVFDRSIN